MSEAKQRLVEIDALRGVAIVMMVIFHFVLDLELLGLAEIKWYGPFWSNFAFVTRALFLFLVGVSISLSKRDMQAQLWRAGTLLFWGLVVSFATWLWAGPDFVRFGILSAIAFTIPLATAFKANPWMALIAAGLSVWLAPSFAWVFDHLLFSTWDYVPLFPYAAWTFLGVAFGTWVYFRKGSKPKATAFKVLGKLPGLSWLGRHSLAIYLLHIPVLYFTLQGLSKLIS